MQTLVSNFNIQKVLIAPLDWGLGHATRCIPIIKVLIASSFEVVIATEGKQFILLQNEFPDLKFLPLKGYGIVYSKYKKLLPLKILLQLPKMLSAMKYEHNWLDKIIDENQIDLVISDNRYGLYSKKVPCIFMTHQLTIKAPYNWLEKMMQASNYKYINRFTACWVPDVEEEQNIAGILSHPSSKPLVPLNYIGLLSRFNKQPVVGKKYDCCILLSGPEPQRSVLEENILKDIDKVDRKVLLVRGKPGAKERLSVPSNVEISNHLAGNDMQQAIMQSEYIISRSGYTTVMELLHLQKKSILIPTPGQTEQEYLGKRLMDQGWCYAVDQNGFDFMQALESAKGFNYIFPSFESNPLQTLIPQLIEKL